MISVTGCDKSDCVREAADALQFYLGCDTCESVLCHVKACARMPGARMHFMMLLDGEGRSPGLCGLPDKCDSVISVIV